MKINLLSILSFFFALFLLCSGYLSLQNALITNAIESRLNYFSSNSNPVVRPNDKKLAETDPNTLTKSAHLLNSFVLLNQWIAYLNQEESASNNWIALLNTSTHIRPTWPNTYVELSKLSKEQQKTSQYQQLAMLFGPYSPSSRLLLIDTIFTHWENSQVSLQMEASQHLIAMTRIWRHRSSLNQMISHSKGKQRICNMLAFNKLKVPTCG
ncbi:MAG: hypothetical protein GY920_18980 [Aliivibrio sp.]|nr:hypothetical protein [Aliivibrio sp.]